MQQLSLFGNQQDHSGDPLPLLVAAKWGFPLAHHIQGEEYFYCVQDWIAGICQCGIPEATQSLHNLERNGQLVFSKQELPYLATNGKTYQIAHTNDKGLYLIAGHLRVTKKRPALKQIKEYLAALGVLFDAERLNPELAAQRVIGRYEARGKSPAWIETRINGIATRKMLTAAIMDCVSGASDHTIAVTTDQTYVKLLQYTAKQLRELLGLKPRENPRDWMGYLALSYLSITEGIISDKLRNLGEDDMVSLELATEVINHVAGFVRAQYEATQQMLGIDLITERPLLVTGG